MNANQYEIIRYGNYTKHDKSKPILIKLILPSIRSLVKSRDLKPHGQSSLLLSLPESLPRKLSRVNRAELEKFERLITKTKPNSL